MMAVQSSGGKYAFIKQEFKKSTRGVRKTELKFFRRLGWMGSKEVVLAGSDDSRFKKNAFVTMGRDNRMPSNEQSLK
jgi:hypothetical protein